MIKKRAKSSFFLIFSFFLLLGLSGCASYKARPLAQIPAVGSNSFVVNGPISFKYHIFDKWDCKKYLDRNVLAKGYQPIHISITNNSNKPVNFSLRNISLPVVDVYEVAQKVHTNTVGRAVGYGVTGIFIWPFVIPAIVDGVGSHKANEQLDYDFTRKALHDQKIQPHASIDGLIFVPVESNIQDFQITLTDSKTHKAIMVHTNQAQSEFYA